MRALPSEGQHFAQAPLGNSVTHAVHFSAPGIHASDAGENVAGAIFTPLPPVLNQNARASCSRGTLHLAH